MATAAVFLILNLSSAVARIWEGENTFIIVSNLGFSWLLASSDIGCYILLNNCVAVFMLYVAFRCYQQSSITDEWVEDEAGSEEK